MSRHNVAVDPPSSEEVAKMNRAHLATNGCEYCNESDPDKLHQESPVTHSCPRVQQPDCEPIIVCDECEQPSIRIQMLNRVRKKHEANYGGPLIGVALYTCGMFYSDEAELVDNPAYGAPNYEKSDQEQVYETEVATLPGRIRVPEGPYYCPRCGEAEISEVLTINEVLEETVDEDNDA